MRNRAIEYPHPVLNEYTNDFLGCDFSIEVISHGDTGDSIALEISASLNCDGLTHLISEKYAKIVLRVTCFRTSFRTVYDLSLNNPTVVTIPKKYITDVLDMQAMIVTIKDMDNYTLAEFNSNYFGSSIFILRKGDVLANEPGIKIKLNTVLEKNMSGIVQVSRDPNLTEMKVHFASIEETDPALSDYIVITLPTVEYDNWAKLRTKKHLKNGVERFLQSAVILPAITEAIGILRREELIEHETDDPNYKGTVWADSIMAALHNMQIDELATCNQSDYVLANKLLGNVTSDSINNLMQKMTDWSTIRQEDDIL